MEPVVCDACGKPLQVGDFPWCPHGKPTLKTIGDDPFIGGMTIENLGHEPVTVYSRSELKRETEARGLQPFVRHQPLKGSDKSPYTTDWSKGSMDPVTLANAAALLDPARRVHKTGPDPIPESVPLTSLRITVTEIDP